MNRKILNSEVQRYIHEHLDSNIHRISLAKSPFEGVKPGELAEQIDSKKRCEKKLPLWFKTSGIYYPPKLSIEQTSSEQTAAYKSRLAKGNKLVDLTGGFGVDAYYFSQQIKQVLHCEQNSLLSEIARHNAKLLGADNIRFIESDSLEYLKQSSEAFDTIYVDPSRRIESKKVFLLKDTEPDVVTNLPLLLTKADRVIIKTSPLFDIQSGLKELSQVSEVHVLSVKNDCKEILWVIDKGFSAEPRIISAAIGGHHTHTFEFMITEEKNLQIENFSNPLKYLYEPDVSLLKAGCFKSVSQRFDLAKINKNTHLYTSDTVHSDFIGRIFEVTGWWNYKAMKDLTTRKANIISRNFPLGPDEIKRKFKIQDGGDSYLIFFKALKDQLVVLEAKRLK